MTWALQDLLSHPIAALLCAGLAWRHKARMLGPMATGIVLGWGGVPLVWLLTREPRPAAGDEKIEPGFSPAEPAAPYSWPAEYFALRQRLVLTSLFAILPLPYLFLTIAAAVIPTSVGLFEGMSLELPLWTRILIFLTKFLRTPLGLAMLWSIFALWPVALGWLLQLSYRLPWLGKVWRHCDQIWLHSGLTPPAEVRRRTGSTPAVETLETARAELKASTATRTLWKLALLSWLVTLSLVVGSRFFPLYQLIGHVQ